MMAVFDTTWERLGTPITSETSPLIAGFLQVELKQTRLVLVFHTMSNAVSNLFLKEALGQANGTSPRSKL